MRWRKAGESSEITGAFGGSLDEGCSPTLFSCPEAASGSSRARRITARRAEAAIATSGERLSVRIGTRFGELGEILLVREYKRFRIDAIAQTGRRWTILEDVAQVSVTAGAKDFRASHAVALVFMRDDVFLGNGLKETRPTGSRLELRARGKQ